MVGGDRTSLLALTAVKKYDNYTFTHMVNVSVLAMAQARSLNLEGPLLREFGFAALMHDIGKVHTPLEVLNKPDKLTKEEFELSTICGRISRGTRRTSGIAISTCARRSSASPTSTTPCAASASTATGCRAIAFARS
jgi:hypothetical protein